MQIRCVHQSNFDPFLCTPFPKENSIDLTGGGETRMVDEDIEEKGHELIMILSGRKLNSFFITVPFANGTALMC